ncbi:hypothetical protein CFC21_079596 [Triticum aestivum]|uniref:BHLH domain-containing protein n=2 Tax=Triticum aestivum TaxID=4565 RepID=A0A9R1I0E9_WHEAT|nr:transcription factor bHLH113-like isoform X1 [Triticum aestivum]XP_044401987.1 transcription factor bHLH113-like isoform X1 [Triticum aestivum]KAF7074773.1 hypothetical protein CFC21_079596 [Triticum aestivum]
MVKEEEVMAEAGGRGYLDMLGLGEEAMADYFLCLSPSSSAAVSTTTTTSASTHTVASPTCASYLAPLAAPCHHVLSFGGRAEQQYYGGGDIFGFQYYYHGAGGPAVPVAAPQKSSPTTDCSSSISTMSSSPTATAASGISTSKPQPSKKRGSRGSSDQRKAAPPAASTNKRPRARKERLGERILALQQLVSPFGKTDTASVLHEALGYIRFLHDQVQVLSSPYMQRLPPSSAPPAPLPAVVEPGDLRSRGLCLVPVSCTDHVAGGSGNGADVWSSVPAMGMPATAEEEYAVAAGMLRGDRDHHPSRQLA